MAEPNLARIVADAWEQSLLESPDPFGDSWLAESLGWVQRRTYREHLDEQPTNCYGDLIPRIVTVRRNLRLELGPTRLPPSRLR